MSPHAAAFATGPAPLAVVAAGAASRDADPAGAFPEEPIRALESAGALAVTAGARPASYAEELSLLREVAAADAGVARILGGHLSAVERLRAQAPAALRAAELAAIAAGELRAGVWSADPVAGDGRPAHLRGAGIWGTKTSCAGAGGLQRALVMARSGDGDLPPSAAWVDLTVPGTVEVDRAWRRESGLRSSASHRVTFAGAPVLAVLGSGAPAAEPWSARDAVRGAATWAGAADAAVGVALDRLAARARTTDAEALAVGRLRTAQRTIDLWLGAAGELDARPADPAAIAAQARSAIAGAARAILDQAERATSGLGPAAGTAVDRAARDLRLLLREHCPEPVLAAHGRAELAARR